MGKIMGLIDDVDPMPKGLGEKVVRQSVPVAVPKVRGRESELLPRGITVLPDGKWNFDPEGSAKPPGPAAPYTIPFQSTSQDSTKTFSVGDRVRWTWGSGKENGPGQITSLGEAHCEVIFPENPHGIFMTEDNPAYIVRAELEHLP